MEKEIKSKLREKWIDVAKGITILIVLLSHFNLDRINKVIYYFNTTAFFILAGFFFKKKNMKKLVLNKANRLLKPYYYTCIGVCLLGVFSAKFINCGINEILKKYFWASLYGSGRFFITRDIINPIGPIWFLYALFFAFIICNLLIENKYAIIILSFVAILSYLSFELTNIWFPLSIQSGVFASIYVYVGYKYKNYFCKECNILLFVTALLIFILNLMYSQGFYIHYLRISNGIFDVFASICSCYCIFSIAKYINKFNIFIKDFLLFCGEKSIYILCIHTIEMRITWTLMNSLLIARLGFNIVLAVIITYVFRVIICVGTVWLAENYFIKVYKYLK